MITTFRYAIVIFVRAMIPSHYSSSLRKQRPQLRTEPDYRWRTIYFLLGDRFNLIWRR